MNGQTVRKKTHMRPLSYNVILLLHYYFVKNSLTTEHKLS